MRADRLVAIVLLLQVHGQLTAAQLAELLEMSERTVRRDLDALCVAGVPLYSQRGRGGGWALLGGNRLDLTGFTVEEAQALFLVAGSRSSADTGVDDVLRSALRKVFTALPEPLRAHAAAATRSTVFDASGWGRQREEHHFLPELRAAVLARVQVDIDYAKPGGGPERRRVHPYGLVSKGGVWYLLAGTEGGRRTYRLSRLHGLQVSGEPASIPEGFDLAGEWESAERDFLARARLVDVEIEVADGAVLALTASLQGWAGIEEVAGAREGWRRFTVALPHPRAAAVQLAAFGADVRVLSPSDVRQELARIGRELVSAYAGDGATLPAAGPARGG